MPLDAAEKKRLLAKSKQIREKIVTCTREATSGHLGGSLSQTDLMVALYYKYLKFDAKRPEWEDRDRFILSKGHGGFGHAVILGDLGFFDVEEVNKYGKFGSRFGMHMDRFKCPGVEASTGSLGHGFAIAIGMAMGAKLQKLPWHTWVLFSDGECHEGSTWEAAMAAPQFGLTNLTAIVDRNRLTIDGFTEELMPLEPLADKFRAFRWNVIDIDGHDYDSICAAYDEALAYKKGPTVIIGNTVKGKGVDFMENVVKWHYGGVDTQVAERALDSLRRHYEQYGL